MTEMLFGSQWERNIYLALTHYEIQFDYQVAHWYGRRRRGGTVIDFVVYDPPGRVALWVDGPYWHDDAQSQMEDRLIRAKLEVEGYRNLMVREESETEEKAKIWVKATFL